MIRRLILAAAALLAAAPTVVPAQTFPSRPAVGTPKPFKVPASESFKLPNGMLVTLIPYGIAPKTVLSLRVYSGNLNEGNDTWLADLTGEMLNEGAAGRSAAQIADEAASMGGGLGIGVGAHETGLSISVLSEFGPRAVALLADVAQRPNLPASEFDRVKQNLARNLALAKSEPGTLADVALAQAYYGNHPYGRVLPTEAQLAEYDLADVQRFYADNFGAARARLYVAGQFDNAAMKAAIMRAFSGWKAGPQRLSLPPTPTPGPQLILVDRPGAPQSTLRIAFAAPAAGAAEDIPFRVSNSLLGGSFNSRITNNIRENKGYTYSPYSGINFNAGEASWTFDADVTTNVTGAALHEVFSEIRRLQTEPPTAEESSGTRAYLAGTFILSNSSASSLIGSIANRDFHGLPTNWLDQYVPTVLAVTPAQMEEAARTSLPLEKMTVVVVGDLKTVRPQIEALPEFKGVTPKVVTIQ